MANDNDPLDFAHPPDLCTTDDPAKVVLRYNKQWQTEGKENSRQTILPLDQGCSYGSPHHNIFFLIPLSLGLLINFISSSS